MGLVSSGRFPAELYQRTALYSWGNLVHTPTHQLLRVSYMVLQSSDTNNRYSIAPISMEGRARESKVQQRGAKTGLHLIYTTATRPVRRCYYFTSSTSYLFLWVARSIMRRGGALGNGGERVNPLLWGRRILLLLVRVPAVATLTAHLSCPSLVSTCDTMYDGGLGVWGLIRPGVAVIIWPRSVLKGSVMCA